MSNHQTIKRRACCIQSKSSVQKSGMVTRSDHAGRPFACLASWLCRCRTLHSSIHFSQHSRCTKLLQQTSPRSIDHQARPQAFSGEAAAASLWDAQVVSNSMIWFKLIWYIYIYIIYTVYPGRKKWGVGDGMFAPHWIWLGAASICCERAEGVGTRGCEPLDC